MFLEAGVHFICALLFTEAVTFVLADLSSQSECGDVSTFRTARKHSQELPTQSSTVWLPSWVIPPTSWLQVAQTFRPAIQVQPSGPCSNQNSRHRPNRLANIHQYRAFVQLSTLVPPIRVQLESPARAHAPVRRQVRSRRRSKQLPHFYWPKVQLDTTSTIRKITAGAL